MADTRFIRILKNLDALGCTLIANRAKVGEYISTYVWRVRKGWAIRFIDWLFDDINVLFIFLSSKIVT
jgi:hypothetical protein